jgi:hypothetical protein
MGQIPKEAAIAGPGLRVSAGGSRRALICDAGGQVRVNHQFLDVMVGRPGIPGLEWPSKTSVSPAAAWR